MQKRYLLKLFREWKEEINESNGGVSSRLIYLIHCKNLCKCHNVALPNTIQDKNRDNTEKKTP
jgi:hypothetical protein